MPQPHKSIWLPRIALGSTFVSKLRPALELITNVAVPAHIKSLTPQRSLDQRLVTTYLFASRQAIAVIQQAECNSHVLLCSLRTLKLGLMGASVPACTDQPLQLPVRVCIAGQACKQFLGFLIHLQLVCIIGAHLHQCAQCLQTRLPQTSTCRAAVSHAQDRLQPNKQQQPGHKLHAVAPSQVLMQQSLV